MSPKAAGKSDLENHWKFPLYLVTNWFKNLWKVPLEITPYVSRTKKDLPGFVHWSWRHSWLPFSWLLSFSLSLMYHMHTVPFTMWGHGVYRPIVPTQLAFCLRGLAIKCVLTCWIMPYLNMYIWKLNIKKEAECFRQICLCIVLFIYFRWQRIWCVCVLCKTGLFWKWLDSN